MDTDTRRWTQMAGEDAEDRSLTGTVLGAAFEVSTQLGHGFLELVYRRAMLEELMMRGLRVEEEVPFKITYKGRDVGAYKADLLVEGRLILELKAVDALSPSHVGQLVNYLKASGVKRGLLLNFGTPRLTYKRVAA